MRFSDLFLGKNRPNYQTVRQRGTEELANDGRGMGDGHGRDLYQAAQRSTVINEMVGRCWTGLQPASQEQATRAAQYSDILRSMAKDPEVQPDLLDIICTTDNPQLRQTCVDLLRDAARKTHTKLHLLNTFLAAPFTPSRARAAIEIFAEHAYFSEVAFVYNQLQRGLRVRFDVVPLADSPIELQPDSDAAFNAAQFFAALSLAEAYETRARILLPQATVREIHRHMPQQVEGTTGPTIQGSLESTFAYIRSQLPPAGKQRDIQFALAVEALLAPQHYLRVATSKTLKAFDCAFCFEPKQPHEAANLACCANNVAICIPCARNAILRSDKKDVCPTGCEQLLAIQDLYALKLPESTIHATSNRIAAVRLAQIPHWQVCPEKDCIGGASVPDKSRATQCISCVHPVSTEYDALVVKKLLQGLLATGGLQHDQGAMRECYHCGIATEKNEGCNIMTCKCGGEWHFDFGIRPDDSHFTMAEDHCQHFRPICDDNKSILAAIGFYDTTIPKGRLSDEHFAIVQRRAAEWLAEFERLESAHSRNASALPVSP